MASADKLQLEIATPERQVVDAPADSVTIPGRDGYMGILPGHAALLSELGEGQLSFIHSGQTQKFQIAGGYVEVRDNYVRVLADKVE